MPYRFDPFGVGGDDEEPGFRTSDIFSILPKGAPGPDPADIIRFAKAAGIIPPDVDNENIMIGMIGPDGPVLLGETGPVNLGGERSNPVRTWKPGTPLPHTTFDDPPFMMEPEEWQQKLAANAVMAADRDEFSLTVQESLGYDMVRSHGVPIDTAMDGCEQFAFKVYDEIHKDDAQHQ